MYLSKHGKSGFTLLEMLITTGAFAVVLGTLFIVVKMGSDSWLKVQSQRSTQVMLRNVEIYMLDDLRRASLSQMKVEKLSVGGVESQVLWFLSAMGYDDSKTADRQAVFTRTVSGEPVWKRNIVYYMTPISDKLHEARYHYTCPDKATCPHKMLIRKEIVWKGDSQNKDFKPAELLTAEEVKTFLPKSYLNSMTEADGDADAWGNKDELKLPGCKSRICVAECMYDFQVKIFKADDAKVDTVSNIKNYGINVSLTAFNHEEASRNVNAQKVIEDYDNTKVWESEMSESDRDKYLAGRRYLLKYNFRVMPNN
ncbi:MAG: prepilin-type N-terminal cleavage/methylation domain-containing protein [bacterium]|nr:prepilin-type N-terminal cleavage/methylation domain-containing protein [bacterium]